LQQVRYFEDVDLDPTGWFFTEKLDGIHVLWNGEQLFTRKSLIPIQVPSFITDNLPNMHLEGELWGGRNGFDLCMKHVNGLSSFESRNEWENSWKTQMKIKFFDIPISEMKFKDRLEKLKKLIPEQNNESSIYSVVQFQVCKNTNQLLEFHQKISSEGGEGVILMNPAANYLESSSVVKLQRNFIEKAMVKNQTPTGWKCVLTNGKEVIVDPKGELLKENEVIDIRSQTRKYGALEFPKYFRNREDIEWNTLLQESNLLPSNYHLSLGPKFGSNLCRGCKKRLAKHEPRIQTTITWIPHH